MRGLLILAAIAGAVFLAAPAIVHNNVNPIIRGICSLATSNSWQVTVTFWNERSEITTKTSNCALTRMW
jgi:hypothetical protein